MGFKRVLLPKTTVNVWSHFGLFELGRGATGISWVETRDAPQHPTMHSAAPTTKNCPAENTSSAPPEKLLFFWGFLKQNSQVFSTFSVMDSMPEISKREEKGTPRSSLQWCLHFQHDLQNPHKICNLQSSPSSCPWESTDEDNEDLAMIWWVHKWQVSSLGCSCHPDKFRPRY